MKKIVCYDVTKEKMASLIPGYEYDIFISYRQKDNKGDRWVSEFVEALKTELESTFKEEISVYFDINPQDGLLETHDVDASLKERLKCLVFIPIISRTYCDPKSFAWEHEFKAFVEQASKDQFGLKVKLPNGNIANRVLPVRIHDLDNDDIKQCESVLGSVLRGIEFIYKESGFNRPLKPDDDEKVNLSKIKYRNQITKVALGIKEIISGVKNEPVDSISERKDFLSVDDKPLIKEKSIIVLPFENMSPDPDQEYFSDGLTEEIITDLSHVHDLLVISRNSAMTFKGTKKKTKEIASEVNVRYVLEGSVRKAGNNLRITAQLIDGINDSHIWAEKYSGTLDDVFDIQEKVSQAIVDILRLRLTPYEERQIAQKPIPNVQAYDFYLRARDAVLRYTKESLDEASQFLGAALDVIGPNALLYAALGYVYYGYSTLNIDKENAIIKAETYAKKALGIDPKTAQALTILGLYESELRNHKLSIQYFNQALTIDPNDYDAAFWLVVECFITGKMAEGLRYANRLVQLDPINPRSLSVRADVYFFLGKFDLAVEETQPLIQAFPEVSLYQSWWAFVLISAGRYHEALTILEEVKPKSPSDIFGYLALTLRAALRKENMKLNEIFPEEALSSLRSDPFNSWWIASIIAMFNDHEEALLWLENAVALGFINYPYISKYDPFLLNLHHEERFNKLMERVKKEWEEF